VSIKSYKLSLDGTKHEFLNQIKFKVSDPDLNLKFFRNLQYNYKTNIFSMRISSSENIIIQLFPQKIINIPITNIDLFRLYVDDINNHLYLNEGLLMQIYDLKQEKIVL
jgi:hypothetical protein